MEMTLLVLPRKHTVPAKAPSEKGVIPARITLPNQEIQPFLKNCHRLIRPWHKLHEALPTARETEARGRLRAKTKKLGTESGLSESQSTCFLNVKLNPEAARVVPKCHSPTNCISKKSAPQSIARSPKPTRPRAGSPGARLHSHVAETAPIPQGRHLLRGQQAPRQALRNEFRVRWSQGRRGAQTAPAPSPLDQHAVPCPPPP